MKFFSFLSFGSKFQYNVKTEYQTLDESRKRTVFHFSKSPSKRYARRTMPIGWARQGIIKNQHIALNKQSNGQSSTSLDNVNNAEQQEPQIVDSNKPQKDIAEYHRPRSQILKSFMFIDESRKKDVEDSSSPSISAGDQLCKNGACETGDQHDASNKSSVENNQTQLKESNFGDTSKFSDSIRKAFFPPKKAGSTAGFARLSKSLFNKFLATSTTTASKNTTTSSDNRSHHLQHHHQQQQMACFSSSAHNRNSLPSDLESSIQYIKENLKTRRLLEEFEQLSRKNDDESLEESKLVENIDKNRYRDILPYDSTRVALLDSMTGDYINASYVRMSVPSGEVNSYIATQGPLQYTCDDFWQMVWEKNCSLVIMVTPLIEAGKVKCHKYWPDEKEHIRHGQIRVCNLKEKSRAATIQRTFQIKHIKFPEERITTQIQYRAWPDHEVPEDCSDFLKLVRRVRKHRTQHPKEPVIVHCSAGIGRTGVLILMETAICVMKSGKPVYPIKILEDMRKQRAMLIQTCSQFEFVADAICKVYDQKLHKNFRKHLKLSR